ncbi:hypothetical protein OF83DRAFT_1178651 [Amylostereum chailletii]|nr:hypothetical protein OF83DRAFT_1178651 [Amylostereum chailletii]
MYGRSGKPDLSGYSFGAISSLVLTADHIIEATQDVEGLTYRPRTAETREVYELILSSVHQVLGDQAQDIVCSAADAVLEMLKNESMKDFDKTKGVEEVTGPISNEI